MDQTDAPATSSGRNAIAHRSAIWNTAHESDQDRGPVGSQSIQRALVVLNLVGLIARDHPEGASLAEIARISERPKPTVHRVLSALVGAGFVERDPGGGHYRLGRQAQVLGALAGQRPDPLTRLATESLVRLAVLSEDANFLTVRRGSYGICAYREEGTARIRNHALAVGDRHPLGVGAGSLAILSALGDQEVDEVLRLNRSVLGRHYRLLDEAALRSLVERSRRIGYALNDGLVVPGSWAIGLAIRSPDAEPVAALSIATIEQRLDRTRQVELVAAMQTEVGRIEAGLTADARLETQSG